MPDEKEIPVPVFGCMAHQAPSAMNASKRKILAILRHLGVIRLYSFSYKVFIRPMSLFSKNLPLWNSKI